MAGTDSGPSPEAERLSREVCARLIAKPGEKFTDEEAAALYVYACGIIHVTLQLLEKEGRLKP